MGGRSCRVGDRCVRGFWRQRSFLERGQLLFQLCFAACIVLYVFFRDIRLIEASLGFLVIFQRLDVARIRMPGVLCWMLAKRNMLDDQASLAFHGPRIARLLCFRAFVETTGIGASYAFCTHVLLYGTTVQVLAMVAIAMGQAFYLLWTADEGKDKWLNDTAALKTALLVFLFLWVRLQAGV